MAKRQFLGLRFSVQNFFLKFGQKFQKNQLFDPIFLLFEITLGMQWLHSHRIIHLDLKPSNIFLTDIEFQRSKALIADFGLSRKLLDKHEVKKRKSLTPLNTSSNSLNSISREKINFTSGPTLKEYKTQTNVEINEFGEVRVFAGTPDFCAPEVLRAGFEGLILVHFV